MQKCTQSQTSSVLRYQSRTEAHELRQVRNCRYQMLFYETIYPSRPYLLYDRQSPPLFNMAIAPKLRHIHNLRRRRGTRCKALPPVRDGHRLLRIGFIQTGKRVVMDTEVWHIQKRPSGSASATCSSVTRQALLSRITSLCLVPSPRTFATPSSADPLSTLPPAPTHLLDAYRGAGLFSLTFAPHFTQVASIGLSPDANRFATHNVELDALAPEVSFRSGERRADLQRTALVVGSPRKGRDAFVRRLPAPCADGRVVRYTRRGRRGDRVVGCDGREIRPGNLR
ncbi:hypothetical protein EDB85DRAFT_743456 [Lactarius pseudohatsudake]|nr:hypothetical protein EDB85DRAFT_743456 [Lactarius pseudohatsudake]